MKRILVIEDEPQMLLGLRDNLELEGYEVQTAADGEQGLARAAAFNPDLVILDLMLPRKNGFDVCRELRERSSDDVDRDAHGALGRDRQGARASSSAPTTTSPSRSPSPSCWPGCAPCCAAPAAGRPTDDIVRIGDLEIDFKLHQARREQAARGVHRARVRAAALLRAAHAARSSPASRS